MALSERSREAICASKREDADDGVIDIQERRAQRSGNGMSVNLTDLGRRVHSIEQSDAMKIVVHEDGIWIERDE